MTQPEAHETDAQTPKRGGRGWMMVVFCFPMLVIAIVLVATGVASAGFLFVALGCTAMMAMMMRGMRGMTRDR